MENINYTNSYDIWYNHMKNSAEIPSLVGEVKETCFLDCFEKITTFFLAPCCIINEKVYMIQSYTFNSIEDIEQFLIDRPLFKLFRCIKSNRNGVIQYFLRGSLR